MREFHPIANLFPLMTGAAFDEIVADIREHGLLYPIVIDDDGRIVDGRNRARACDQLGIEPEHIAWNGVGTLLQFVVSLNLHRRHLSTTERGLIAARLVTTEAHRPRSVATATLPTVSLPDAAALFNVSRDTVQRAHTVLRSGDDALIAAVERGEINLHPAVDAINRTRRRAAAAPAAPASPPQRRYAPQEETLATLRELAEAGYSSRQMSKRMQRSEEYLRKMMRQHAIECRGDLIVGGSRRLRADDLMERLVYSAAHLTADVGLIDFDELRDPRQIESWIAQLRIAGRDLNAFIRRLVTKEGHINEQNHSTENSTGREDLRRADRADARPAGARNTA